MRGPEVQSASFPTALCSACEKVVLTYIVIHDGGESRRCVDCDGAIAQRLDWINADELEELGYRFGVPGEKRSGGCGGGGCGSCSR
jgi:NMD protein affecting ribosome stability and mRNA decay